MNKLFGKFKILRFLVSTSCIKAGRLQRMPRRWYLSVTTAMYLFSTIVLINKFCEQVSRLAEDHPPGGPSTSSQPLTGSGNSTLYEPPEDEEPLPPPPPKNDSSSTESEESVIQLTTTTNYILSNLISIVLRIFGFAFFPQIRRSFQSLMAREFSAACYKWNRNEFIFILVIICAVALQIYQHVGRPPFHFRLRRSSYKILLQVFFEVFMAQCYPLDCVSFALLVFTTVVTQNLEELSSYLGPSEDKEDYVEKELETLLDLQLSVKMNPSAVAVKKQAGNEAGDKKSQPLFILRHYPTIEIRGSEDLAYLTQRYLRWYELWKEASGVTGFVTLLIFLNCAVNLCIYAYTGLTNLGNDGLLGRDTLENLILAFLSILRLLCLGNAAQYLVDAVSFFRSTRSDKWIPLAGIVLSIDARLFISAIISPIKPGSSILCRGKNWKRN